MRKYISAVMTVGFAAAAAQAQELPSLNIGDNTVQFHAFASQGFAYTGGNNYLTMDTNNGSFAMTDAAANASTQLTNHFRIAAQVYVRDIGELGGWEPHLDYAFGDYRFKDWFGIRAGRVKTTLGLYNDTQDADFLRTWALLPQSVYPTDLRSTTIAHDGVDLYGNIPLHKAGSLDYTAYAGTRPVDNLSGDRFQYEDYIQYADHINSTVTVAAKTAGADLRWTTPLSGLMLGVSQTVNSEHVSIAPVFVTGVFGPYRTTAYYADYTHDRWHFDGEFRSDVRFGDERIGGVSVLKGPSGDDAGFAAVAYRLNKWLEFGTYNSRYYYHGVSLTLSGPAANHVFDQAVSARFDLTKFCNFKIEGHFMNGYGDPSLSPRGFYTRSNPNSLQPDTNMLLLRIGFYL